MEHIPEQWTELRRKAGADDVPSLLNLIWDPGYEAAYQEFLDRVRSTTAGYLQGVEELTFITKLPGAPGLTASVWTTAVNLKSQAQPALARVIKTAAANNVSEGELQNLLWMEWVRMEGVRYSEIDARLHTLSHSAMGWYASFLRRYVIQIAFATAIFKVWSAFIRKAIAVGMYSGAKALQARFPEQMRPVGIALKPFKDLRDVWITRGTRIPEIVRTFVASIKATWKSGGPQGIVYSSPLLESLKHGLPVIGPFFAGVMGGLLAVLLTNYTVNAPGLDSEELDAIYSNPNWARYRQEVAKTVADVYDIENRLDALESPSFDTREGREATISRLRDDIQHLFLSQGNEYLSSAKDQLTKRLEALGGHPLGAAAGPGIIYEYFKQRTDQGIPDTVIDAYYDDTAILEVLAPQIGQLLNGRDPMQLSDEEIVSIIQQAANNSQPALEAYATRLSEQVYKEQAPVQEADQGSVALETVTEAAQRLEDLMLIQSTNTGDYEQVVRQIEAAKPSLDSESISVADGVISAVKDMLAAFGGTA